MKVRLSTLRKIIREAVVDTMRLPKGPNSRDDGEDKKLTDKSDIQEEKDSLGIANG